MNDRTSMRVGTWNVQGVRGIGSTRLDRVCEELDFHRLDVVLLQEVPRSLHASGGLAVRLQGIGLTEQTYSGDPASAEKRYGNVIASRWPLTALPWPARMRWPQLVCAAELHLSSGPVAMVSAHIPNGSGNGWEKVYAFEGLQRGLTALNVPIVLGGDFNEPKSAPPRWLSFRADDNGGTDGDFRDLYGVIDQRRRWQEAVASVLDDTGPAGRTAWGGRHVSTSVGHAFEATHLVRGRFERYFDHLLITEGITAQKVCYHHGVRDLPAPASDHSLVTAALTVGH